MIHYGKELSGDLMIRLTPDEVNEVYQMILSAGLQQRRSFCGLKAYIEDNYRDRITPTKKTTVLSGSAVTTQSKDRLATGTAPVPDGSAVGEK